MPFGYIQNGPIVRHNDWPYTDQKVEIYQRMMQTRMVTDLPYIRWKLNALMRKLCGR